MPCLLLIVALVTPRLAVFVLWLFGWFNGVFPNIIWPILGFIFLPSTLLWYSAVAHWYHGVWTPFNIAILVVAMLIDLSPAGGRRRRD